MITYEVPLERFPETYNDKPLMYAALASQKNHMSLYLMGCYMSPDIRKNFEDAYKKSGKKFDAGKSCIRFKKVQDLSLEQDSTQIENHAKSPPHKKRCKSFFIFHSNMWHFATSLTSTTENPNLRIHW